ncbi:TPA: acetolactate synthase large subunit [Pseudomonas aeruginosa]|nr:acetolactate synthase large subunit [Pseudomonas aeruginosa]
MAKAADVVVQCLENEGVQYVFGIPGEENLDLLESLRKSQIRLVLTRHEQSAGFMAATYGRLTGKTGVSLSTLGPGATNLVTAGAYAYLGGMPMLMITGQKPIKKSKQGRFQILDVVGMMQPLTKYTHQLASADNIPSRVREAFRLAEEEKPGAVHLELPEDIAAEQTDSLPIPPSLSRRPLAEYKAICAAVEKLRAARSPILVIGAGANRKMTAKVLKQLIDKTGIPFVTTQMGKGVVDERHPRFPLYPQRLVADVRRALPSQGIVALDNGMYKIWFARNYKAHMPNTVLLDNALATMGAGLPSAMAAHLVYPDRPIVAVCGDGGFMMNSQELETAVRLKMNLTVIILRDNGYGMIRWKQSNMGFADFGLDYGNPDFVRYAEAYGAHGHRVDSAEGFLPLLERCLGTPGVHVIDCPVDYSENDRILNVELRERALAV